MNLGGTVKVIAVVAADGDVKSVEPKGGSPSCSRPRKTPSPNGNLPRAANPRRSIELHFDP